MGRLKDISDYRMAQHPGKPTPIQAAAEYSFTKEKLRAYTVCLSASVMERAIKVQEGQGSDGRI